MAKIHQNAEKFPIQWNGKVVGGETIISNPNYIQNIKSSILK